MLLGILLTGLLVSFLLVIVPSLPGRREREFEIRIAADPKTIWDIYFGHVSGCDYRPGTRLLSAEIVSQEPLTVRSTWQVDYLSKPAHTTSVYEIYQPYTHYRLRGVVDDPPAQGAVDVGYEEGELRQQADGTRLSLTIISPSDPRWLVQWLAGRRIKRNLAALKDVCEGRWPEAPRGAFSPLRPWQWYLIYLGLGALALLAAVPPTLVLPLAAPMAGVLLLHWAKWVMRVGAVPTFKRASRVAYAGVTTAAPTTIPR